MVEAQPGVEHGDDDARAAGRQVPGLLGVDRRGRGAGRCAGDARRLEVPLADRRAAGGSGGRAGDRTRRVEGVVRGGDDVLALVGHGVLDVLLGRDPRREAGRIHALREDHVSAVRQGAPCGQLHADARAERLRLHHLSGVRAERLLLHQLGLGAVLHDHPRRLGAGHRADLGERRVRGQGQQQGRGEGRRAGEDSTHGVGLRFSVQWGCLRPSGSTAS